MPRPVTATERSAPEAGPCDAPVINHLSVPHRLFSTSKGKAQTLPKIGRQILYFHFSSIMTIANYRCSLNINIKNYSMYTGGVSRIQSYKLGECLIHHLPDRMTGPTEEELLPIRGRTRLSKAVPKRSRSTRQSNTAGQCFTGHDLGTFHRCTALKLSLRTSFTCRLPHPSANLL